jgi:hypothetical protein
MGMRATKIGLTSLAAGLLLFAACSSSNEVAPEPKISAARLVADFQENPIEKVVDSLFVQATHEHPNAEELATWSQRIRNDASNLQKLIEELLRDPRFTAKVGPELLVADMAFHATRYLQLHGWVLKKFKAADGREIYYTRTQCQPNETEKVRPWWAPKETVEVCRLAHQPANFFNPKTKLYCGAAPTAPTVAPDDFCGCGPNLMRCYPSLEVRNKIQKSIVAEAQKTLEHIVAEDWPVGFVYTTKFSHRDRYVETIYRTWEVEYKHLKELPGLEELESWPAEGKWAERREVQEGEHAGVLTMPNVAFNSSGLRAVMRNNYEHLWCVTPKSSNVDIHDILQLGDELRNARAGQGWEKLAKRPICTDCHARLDYGMQFFKGFFDVRVGVHYDPTKQPEGQMRIYADDIEDLRGAAKANPAGFASLAVRQREFARCNVERINKQLYGEETTLEDSAALLTNFDPFKTTTRDLMRKALNRFGERLLQGQLSRRKDVQLVVAERTAPEPEKATVDLSQVKVVVADAIGNKAWGTQQIVEGARLALAEGVGNVISTQDLNQAQKKLRHNAAQRRDTESLAEAGKEAGADYVLRIELTKKRWLYTARAVLINTASAEEQMDFRAQYYKPEYESEDRGARIGTKAVWKLGVLQTGDPNAVVASAPANEAGDHVALSSRALELLDDVCTQCHNEGELAGGLDLEGAVKNKKLPHDLAFKILNDVSSFEMPPMTPGLEPWDRRALLSDLVAEIWKGDQEKLSSAQDYFVERNRVSSVYPLPVAINTIVSVTGSEPEEKRLLEQGVAADMLQYSPGFVAGISLMALDACKKAGHQNAQLDECLRKATTPSLYIKDFEADDESEEKSGAPMLVRAPSTTN